MKIQQSKSGYSGAFMSGSIPSKIYHMVSLLLDSDLALLLITVLYLPEFIIKCLDVTFLTTDLKKVIQESILLRTLGWCMKFVTVKLFY